MFVNTNQVNSVRLSILIISICLFLGITISVANHTLVTGARGSMNWDEGDYYRWATRIAQDVSTADFSGFWSNTHRQRVHPFLFSWLAAPIILAKPSSLATLLLQNHLILALFPLIISLLLIHIFPRLRPWEAICFALIFSTAPVTLEYASVFMPEFIGLLLLFSGLLLWGVALVRPTRSLAWFAGLILPAVFFLKYSLGIILLAAIAFGVFERLIRRERFPTGCGVPLFAPFTVLSLLWFLMPLSGKIRGFFAFVINRSPSEQINYLQNLVTYLTVLRDMLVASPWLIGWFILGVIPVLMAAYTDRLTRFHLVALFVAVFGFVFHPYTIERLTIHMVPSVWLLLVTGYDWLSKRYRKASYQKCLIWSLIFFSVSTVLVNGRQGCRQLPVAVAGNISPIRLTNWWIHPEIAPVFNKISDAICNSEQVVWIVGETNELNPGAIEFSVERACADPGRTLIHDVVYPGDVSRSRRDMISVEQANQVIESVLSQYSPDVLIVINVEPGSVLDNEDYRLWHQWETEIKSQIRHQRQFKRRSVERFEELGLTVAVYSRKKRQSRPVSRVLSRFLKEP